jgi:hypothetical protein
MRRLADQHEALLDILSQAPGGLPPHIESFARCSATLARTAAMSLDSAVNLHLIYAKQHLGATPALPRPKLRLVSED